MCVLNLEPALGGRDKCAAIIRKANIHPKCRVHGTSTCRAAAALIAWPFRAHYHPLQQRGEVPVAREQRKLAAILAADVVDYSRLMGRDKSGTLVLFVSIEWRD
jgi:hypothetical protein